MFRNLAIVSVALFPLLAHAAPPVPVCETTWIDQGRADRAVPVRIRMPAGAKPAPVILFSHGLGGSLDSGTDWVEAWVAAGFMTVNIDHPGSDAAIRNGRAHPIWAMLGAMNAEQLQTRADDVHFVLDQIARGGHVGACDLARANMSEVGMSGHSFGAQTTLAISGAQYAGQTAMRDPRIKASIAFSPQPSRGVDDGTAFGAIKIPFFTVTGTKDSFALNLGTTAQDRLRPYQAMPVGAKYLLVVDGANHLMLNGQTLPRPGMTPPADMVDIIARATILFWQTMLMHDRAAAAELQALGTRLPPEDRFAMK